MKRITGTLFAVLFFLVSFPAFSASLKSYNCPVEKLELDDGDSFACGGKQIRVLGVDTPEIKHPQHGISIDQPYGMKAKKFTDNAFKKAKIITIVPLKKDKYGRTLAHVLIDGNLLSVMLINAGLGYETIGRYGDGGFPEFALQITDAWKASKKPKFEDPHDWRKKNQTK